MLTWSHNIRLRREPCGVLRVVTIPFFLLQYVYSFRGEVYVSFGSPLQCHQCMLRFEQSCNERFVLLFINANILNDISIRILMCTEMWHRVVSYICREFGGSCSFNFQGLNIYQTKRCDIFRVTNRNQSIKYSDLHHTGGWDMNCLPNSLLAWRNVRGKDRW